MKNSDGKTTTVPTLDVCGTHTNTVSMYVYVLLNGCVVCVTRHYYTLLQIAGAQLRLSRKLGTPAPNPQQYSQVNSASYPQRAMGWRFSVCEGGGMSALVFNEHYMLEMTMGKGFPMAMGSPWDSHGNGNW